MDLFLKLRVAILRLLFSYNEHLERKQEPRAPQPTIVETIPSTSLRGFVSLMIYTPSGFRAGRNDGNARYPLVIDFHGGGFTAGTPSMDARWISTLLAADTQPVVVGVDYGLAPENAFPGPVQDAVAAMLWLANEGVDKYAIDPQRIVLAGFSAGGTLALTAPMWIASEGPERPLSPDSSTTPSKLQDMHFKMPHPLRGVLCAYPGLDYRIPRKPADSMLARFMSNTWDDAYFRRSPIDSPFVSPSAADDSLLQTGLPQSIGLYPVADDNLTVPCEQFRERLTGLGKQVTGHIEPDGIHAWDKYPIKDADAARWRKREEWFRRMTQDVEQMLQI